MDLEEYSKSKNMRIIKKIIGNTFVLGYKKNKDKDPQGNENDQSKPHPKNPPVGNDNIKDKPRPPIGDKPCVKPKQNVY